ncbi:hypothetical protein KPSA1B_104500 [Pseudomonas syringae pv. actinidiae]|nr:hypothetical protein KPSA1B_104500 [Pseudomonas syringae pv. actinidiae]
MPYKNISVASLNFETKFLHIKVPYFNVFPLGLTLLDLFKTGN